MSMNLRIIPMNGRPLYCDITADGRRALRSCWLLGFFLFSDFPEREVNYFKCSEGIILQARALSILQACLN